MQSIPVNNPGIRIPSNQEINLASESSRKLAAYIKSTTHPAFQLLKKGKTIETIAIPTDALQLLITILSQMAKGNAVTLIPVHAELTTQEAADLLNVSRPYLVNLLEEGKIPFRKVGSRRRVFAKDVLRYKENVDKERLSILEELANKAQKHNMGYDE